MVRLITEALDLASETSDAAPGEAEAGDELEDSELELGDSEDEFLYADDVADNPEDDAEDDGIDNDGGTDESSRGDGALGNTMCLESKLRIFFRYLLVTFHGLYFHWILCRDIQGCV